MTFTGTLICESLKVKGVDRPKKLSDDEILYFCKNLMMPDKTDHNQ
jgi:hypothetical protein